MARWDEAAYLAIARNLLAGNGYRELVGAVDLQQPPMVAILAMIGLALHLPLAWAASGPAHLLLGSLVVLPMYGLGRELYGPRVGLMAALLGAIYPALAVSPLYWSTMTEPPYVLFILAGLYATLRCAQSLGGQTATAGRPLGWAALMGGAFGLGYLVRPESLVYLAMMLVYLGIVWFASGHHQPSKVLASAGIAVAITVLLALPYVLYLHRATGLWLASGKQGVSMDISWAYANDSQAMHDKAAASLDPSGKEILWLSPEGFQKTLTGWIAEDPRRFAVLVQTNIRNTWHALFHEDLFTPWIVALMALGLFGQAWTRPRLRRELVLLLALVPLAGLWVFFVLSRFLAVDVAIGLIWAAAGLAQLSRWAGDTGKNLLTKASTTRPTSGRRVSIDLLRVLPVAGTVTLLLTGCIGVAANQLPRQPFLRVETARWLSEHVAGRQSRHDPQYRDNLVCRPAYGCFPERRLATGGGLWPGPRCALPGGGGERDPRDPTRLGRFGRTQRAKPPARCDPARTHRCRWALSVYLRVCALTWAKSPTEPVLSEARTNP